MNAYIYQADLICEGCANKTMRELDRQGKAPEDCLDHESFDSDDYPKGTWGDGGGEADAPQHCGICGLFLFNPLTKEGMDYLVEVVKANLNGERGNPDVIGEWLEWYDVSISVIHRSHCGMEWEEDYGLHSVKDARDAAAAAINQYRKSGFPVTTLDPGKQWEVLEPVDAAMVPDECGTIALIVSVN